jgi:hypothetical protein
MAKRTIRKTDPEDSTAPERRRTTRNGDNAPRVRTTRNRKTNGDASELKAANGRQAADLAAGLRAGATSDAPSPSMHVPHDHIAVRAYHLYLERGGRGGDEFQDWITAERELRERATGNRLR